MNSSKGFMLSYEFPEHFAPETCNAIVLHMISSLHEELNSDFNPDFLHVNLSFNMFDLNLSK